MFGTPRTGLPIQIVQSHGANTCKNEAITHTHTRPPSRPWYFSHIRRQLSLGFETYTLGLQVPSEKVGLGWVQCSGPVIPSEEVQLEAKRVYV